MEVKSGYSHVELFLGEEEDILGDPERKKGSLGKPGKVITVDFEVTVVSFYIRL